MACQEKTEKLYKRVCRDCGREFYYPTKKKQLCPECYSANRGRVQKEQNRLNHKPKKPKQKRIKIDLSINEVVGLMEQYNREHKTRYTYGQFVELLHSGRIKR